jgi:hypothetical protein
MDETYRMPGKRHEGDLERELRGASWPRRSLVGIQSRGTHDSCVGGGRLGASHRVGFVNSVVADLRGNRVGAGEA